MLSTKWRLVYLITFIPLSFLLIVILLIRAVYIRLLFGPARWAMAELFGKARRQSDDTSLIVFPYMGRTNASARYRVYNYLPYIRRDGFSIDVFPPTSESVFENFYLPWKAAGHYVYFIMVFLGRALGIWAAGKYDVVFLQREIISEFFYDPPLFIFLLWANNSKIVYDLDDAVWMLPPHSIRGNNKLLNYLASKRFFWNVRLSKKVIVSNSYLKRKVLDINGSVEIIPTPIDVSAFKGIRKVDMGSGHDVVIGWTGGGGNVGYLKMIERVVARIAEKYPVRVKVISSRPIKLNGVRVDFVQWSEESEFREICTFDVGIMPLPDNAYTRGKAGFKLLLYMAAGIPSVASPVGVNSEIIITGKTGYLARNEEEWQRGLEELIKKPSFRQEMGREAREYVARKYDYSTWAPILVDILKNV